MKHIILWICVFFSPSSHFSASQNIDELQKTKYFIDHQTANAIQLFVPIRRKFFVSLLFQIKSQQRGILLGLLDKYSHLFIYILLKWTLSSGQPFYPVEILTE